MLKSAKDKIKFSWISGDGFYGEQPELLDKLEGEGFLYCFASL